MVGRTTPRRLRRTTGAVVLATLLGSTAGPLAHAQVAPAQVGQTVSLGDLRVQRRLAAAELDQAQVLARQAWANLTAARLAHRRGVEALQDNVAALWMGMKPRHVMDPVFLDGLAAGAQQARDEVELASAGLKNARFAVAAIDGRLKLARAVARQQRAQAASRAAATRASSTIGCPVATPSAIYADFGAPRASGPHRGIDIPAPNLSPALAAWHLRVREVVRGGWMGLGIVLEDGANNTWIYAHLARIDVTVGQIVARGQVIGAVGSTGNSTGPHLHFEIHARGVTPVDPYRLVAPACRVSDPMTPAERVAYEASTDAAN